MEYLIEIGNADEKQLIKKELSVIEEIVEQVDAPINLRQIIVASDFEAKINELEKTETYKAARGMDHGNIVVMAKIAKLEDGFAMVLSPALYTVAYDTKTRFFFFLHEFSHLRNKLAFPPISRNSPHEEEYLHNLYYLYDEYRADRSALFVINVINEPLFTNSPQWDAFVTEIMSGLPGFINDQRYYDFIRNEIELFRDHGSVDLFLNKTRQHFADLSVAISRFFAWLHSHPGQAFSTDLLKSPFVNEKTFALMDYFKLKFEEKEVDLLDGMDLMADFMMNFGLKLEPIDQGRFYCRVLNI